ncbi:d162c718-89af-4bc1-b4f7-555ae5742841 [Sclerotinia trifoliorum]|uniref:D162c718-89af-4bc1-b4f7-555ae5742841 n=1 Tax=Sclerotinia trifoliorum TaxID=28548 RepID=A0A8H2VN28_9HELO|nr:d162c718-89af-4bc1-b4f7-555ae5742841 [Sclerotinia trifoliorum]
MASWKIVLEPVDEAKVQYTSFANARKYFAVDASGSTVGNPFISEHDFADGIHEASLQKDKDTVTRWGSNCKDPTNWEQFSWAPDQGGTSPQFILRNKASMEAIHNADIWFLLTDGDVPDSEVHTLAGLGQEMGVFDCATVFLITSRMEYGPNHANVSVGITSYSNCANALCLFKDYKSGQIYVIAGKGSFAPLDQAEDHEIWDKLTSFPNEVALIQRITELDIHVPTAETRISTPTHLNLGEEWNAAHNLSQPTLVDIDILLRAGVVSDKDRGLLLRDEALDALIFACKSRGKLNELRSFLLAQKVEQLTIKLEDVSGAAEIITQLAKPEISNEMKNILQTKLRNAHKSNRKAYAAAQNDLQLQDVRDRNRAVDAAIRALFDAEKSRFTAEMLSRRSNRARRAENISADSAIDVSVLDLEASGFSGECQICCGENEVLSIALKVLSADTMAANTDNFALDFPLAAGRFEANMNILSSQCICFQCALFGRPGYSIYGEEISAVIPTLEYTGSNKLYIHQQLYKALNAGLKTGVPAMGQLFATILDRTLRKREWAGADAENGDEIIDTEKRQRRGAITWLLNNILTNLRVREKFNELGEWTTYPLALTWVAQDFQREGLTSWCINYPVAGFMQLLRFGKTLNVFSNEIITDMKNTKLLHSFVSTFLSRLYKNMGNPASGLSLYWKCLGNASILNSVPRFWNKLMEFMPGDDFLENWTEEEVTNMMPRIQILAFWMVYYQFSHTSAKTYFAQLRSKEPLALVLLDAKAAIPENAVREILLGIFIESTPKFKNKDLYASHENVVIPFANPFGASILKCGAPECGVSFLPEEVTLKQIVDGEVEWVPRLLDQVRKKRRDHLLDVFAVLGGDSKEEERSETGLPGVTKSPARPSEVHTCMHIGIAKTWVKLTRKEKRYLAGAIKSSGAGSCDEEDEEVIREFVVKARKYVCGIGRGNVYCATMERDITAILPSFLDVLATGLEMGGKEGGDVSFYEFDFGVNKVESKIKWEADALRRNGPV